MQRLLFLLPSFQIGGTNSAFNNFLSKIDRNKFSIDVYSFSDKGPNRDWVAQYAHIISSEKKATINENTTLSLKDVVHRIKQFLFKLHIDISPLAFRLMANRLSANKYDSVISFQEGQATRFLTYFKNTRRIAWIHCDYREHISSNHVKPESRIYSKIDRIVCVSRYTREVFLNVLPDMESKTVYLNNALDVEKILSKSKEPLDYSYPNSNSTFKIISVGRLAPVKRFDMIPQIAADLKNSGFYFSWILIGDGDEIYRKEICDNIKEYAVEDCVFCVGAKTNPYPFIAASDVMVITSLSEACPTVLNEAKVLQVPVVTTNYGSAPDFIEDGKDGFICPIEDISKTLKCLLNDSHLYNSIKENLSQFQYPNNAIMQKFENDILLDK